MIGPLIHVIGVASHAGIPARANWYPWTDDDWQYVGWKVEPHDGGEPTYMYLVPDLENDDVRCGMYVGPHGDPDKDSLWGWVRSDHG